MRRLPLFFAIVCMGLSEILGDIPGCNYFDTVDLTSSHRYKNGSYQYEDVLIPKEETGEYDYEIIFKGVKESVPNHTRGCVCKFKTCVRFCCHPQKELVTGERSCRNIEDNIEYSKVLNITLNNGTVVERHVMEFMVQQHLPVPCADHLFLDADWNENHKWTLFENGSLFRHFDTTMLSKQDYCLQPQNLYDSVYQLVPHHCPEPPDVTVSYIQMVSVFFMFLIICVYLILPNFKGVHFKCCTCYFICLTISFLMLICVSFQLVTQSQTVLCFLVGHIGYFTLMATFLWLLIINYNLWKAFNKIGVARKSRFVHYNIFVWSVAAVLLLITVLVDFIYKDQDVESVLIPGIGAYECWINTLDLSAMIYFYGPILILLLINITLFIKTALRIFVQNRQNRNQLKKSEGQRNLRNLTNFGMFFRFFVIVGVIWILEIVSYIWALIDTDSTGLTIADFLTSGQGIALFAVTILKRDILKSLSDRIRGIKSRSDASTVTSSVPLQMTENSIMIKEEE